MGGMDSSDEAKNNLVVVGNIHVLFNPKRGEMKLGQVASFWEPKGQFFKMFYGSSFLVPKYNFHVGFEWVSSNVRVPCSKFLKVVII